MSGGGTDTTQETTPWGPYKDLHKFYTNEVQGAYGDEKSFFPGSTVEARSGDTAMSYDMLREFTTKNELGGQMSGFLGDVMGGQYMPGADGNPYLDDVFDKQSRKVTEAYQTTVMPTINSRFAAGGRSGSYAAGGARRGADQTLGRTLADMGTDVYYGDYERRMGDRFKAAGMAPAAQGMELGNIGAMRALGADQENYEGRMLQEAIARFQFGQNESDMRLDQFGSRLGVGGGYGSATGSQSGGGDAGLSVGLGVLGMLGSVGGAAFSGGSSMAALPAILAAMGGAAVGPQNPYG